MCGIVGLLLQRGDVGRWRGTIGQAMDLMAARGPDSSGSWSDDAACLLGFRRLSILDLSRAGDQPMVTPDGRFALVFNGELYNFREIRATLGARGVRFRSTGDAEVVLHALAQFGVKALESFNGMFALAFYDAHERRLLLARDHAAIKPLYVLRHREGWFFASQYDQIVSHPWARDRSIDETALSLYLNIGYLPPPAGILSGTFALEAGSWLSVDASGVERQGRWFEFPRFREPDLRGREALDAVDAAVTSAVRRQLVSDVPLGVFLSGGIDSPLVAAKAQEALGPSAPLPAFTLGTNGDVHDESSEAARYARALGLRHVCRHITGDDVLGLLDDVVSATSEPSDDFSIFPTAMISRIAREQVKVVLSGDGGDDVFWGYPGRMIEPLAPAARSVADRARGLVRRVTGQPEDSPPRDRHTGDRQMRMHRFVPPRTLAAIFPSLRQSFPDVPAFAFDDDDLDRTAQYLRWNEYTAHLCKVLQKVDRASMHSSLEVRVPLLDRDVIEVGMRIDWRDCVDRRRLVGKLPLRAALRRHVRFQTMAKRGFTVPMSSWLCGPLRPMFEDLVLPRRELLGMPLDSAALKKTFREHCLTIEDSPWLLWRLLSLSLWDARHLQRKQSVPDATLAVQIA